MKRSTSQQTQKRSVGVPLGKRGGRPKVLSFSDLEVPVEPLLTRDEEVKSGRRIRLSLRRLSSLLPATPAGYLRYVARLQEVSNGGTLMFTWLSRRDCMKKDLAAATVALERARSLAPRSRSRAIKAFHQGMRILEDYPLDPETLYQWSRETIGGCLLGVDPLRKLSYFHRAERCLRRAVAQLEKQRDRLVMPNFRLVLKEVFRYHPTGMKRSDLFQEGILGLHKAVFRFDAERGIRFSTYATYWIRQSIRKCLIDKSRMIRVPQAIQEELRKPNSTLQPTEAERVRRIMGETILFSYGETDSSSDRFSFEVKDPSRPEIAKSLHVTAVPQAVNEALRDLSSRERDVVQRRFGLAGERPQTLEEIGVQLNLSRERIRQIEQEALARMRESRDLSEIYEDLGLVGNTAANTHN